MKDLIEKYGLAPHPEGGYFKEVYRSAQTIDAPLVSAPRNTITQIYFLLTKGQISRFHRVVHDEIWHFYEGHPLALIQYDETQIKKELIGPECRDYTAIVPGNTWQAAETTGEYSLVGCTVAPGFDFTDFSFLSHTPLSLDKFKAQKTGYDRFL